MIDNNGVDVNDAPPGYKAKIAESCHGCCFVFSECDCPRRTVIKYTQLQSWTEMCLPQNRDDGKRVIFISK